MAKILSIVKETNYRPQQRRQQAQTIAVIVFKVNNRPFCDSFMAQLMGGVCFEVFQQGMTVTFVNPDEVESLSPEEFNCYCMNHGIAGVLVSNVAVDHKFTDTLRQSGIPFCMNSSSGGGEGIMSVGTNNYDSTLEILDYMICLGHTQIAFLGLVTNQVDCHRERYRAYCDILQRHGIALRDELVIDLPDAEISTIRNELIRLMSRNERPTALFYCGEVLTRAIPILHSMGFSIPDDISIAGYKMMCDEELLFPDISSIIQPTEEIGRNAVRLLLDRIGKGEASALTLKNKIAYGATVRNLKG